MMKAEIPKPDTFLYFAYGSNLLERFIHRHTPSAEFVSIGRLDNYRMDFIRYSKYWGGPTITMVPTANAHIWGAIWRIHKDDLISLDDQKQVDLMKYYPRNVPILTPYMGSFTCRAYEQKINPLPSGDNDVIPAENWPSKVYKKIILCGALERALPPYYIDNLTTVKDNGDMGCYKMVEMLIRYGEEQPCPCRVPGLIPRRPLKLNRHPKITQIAIDKMKETTFN